MQDRQRAKRGGGALHPTFLGQHREMHCCRALIFFCPAWVSRLPDCMQPTRPLSVKRRDCALSMRGSNYPSPSPASYWNDRLYLAPELTATRNLPPTVPSRLSEFDALHYAECGPQW